MKYYLGIDIGKVNHVVAITDSTGKTIGKPKTFAATSDGWKEFQLYLEKLIDHTEYSSIIAGMEATGHYWLTLYLKLKELDIKVSVLNPLEVKAFRNEGIRGNKTDNIDATKIAKLLRFGDFREAHVPDGNLIALRQLTRLRSDLVTMATSLKQKILAVLDQIFPEYASQFSDVFGATSIAILSQAKTPEAIALLDTKKLVKIASTASRGRFKKEKVEKLQIAAIETFGIQDSNDMFSLALDILLSELNQLQERVDRLDMEIAKQTAKLATTITTIPGIGVATAAVILAEIGNFERFIGLDGAEKLVALAGIDPKLKESGKYQGKTKMSKRGSTHLRSAVRQASFIAVFVSKDPMFLKIYQKQIDRGKHFEVALSHVSRKMLHVIYSLLKNKTEYIVKV